MRELITYGIQSSVDYETSPWSIVIVGLLIIYDVKLYLIMKVFNV